MSAVDESGLVAHGRHNGKKHDVINEVRGGAEPSSSKSRIETTPVKSTSMIGPRLPKVFCSGSQSASWNQSGLKLEKNTLV